jgi:DNA-binding transcriptional MocR family regulator
MDLSQLSSLTIDGASGVPVYRQIADGIRNAVESGTLRPGDRLPPTRALADQLEVNRNTVIAAYDLLAAEGALSSHTGRGTFIAEPETATVSPDRSEARSDAWFSTFSRAVDGPGVERLASVYRVAITRGGISFAGSYPAGDLMPIDLFRRSVNRVLKGRPEEILTYGPTAGNPGLREALAATMTEVGSTVAGDDILITNGAQQALELTFRAFLDPGDVVLVEDPTYTGALSALDSLGARAIGIPTDDEGIRPDFLSSALERHRPRLMYLQPTFRNPTTAVTSESRRREILALAVRHRCPIVEDDWAGDLRFDGEDLPTLHAIDGGEHVVYLSTFSKKLMPGLRIGWVAAPPRALERLVALKQISDCGTSPVLQAALLDFLRQGHLEAHLRRVRTAYRERRDIMLESLARHFPDGVDWSSPEGGLFLWLTLPDRFDTGEIFAAAGRENVLFSRGSLFHVDGQGANTMRLTYAAVPPDRIDRGVEILGEIIRSRWPEDERSDRATAAETIPIL